jgi:hypothetical protein
MAQMRFHALLELALFERLESVGAGIFEAFLPGPGGTLAVAVFFRERDVLAVDALAAFPFVLRDVDGDAVEIGADQGFAAKAGQGAVEAEKDVLGEIVEVVGVTGQAREGAEDHLPMIADDLLEAGLVGQELFVARYLLFVNALSSGREVRPRGGAKVSWRALKLCKRSSV